MSFRLRYILLFFIVLIGFIIRIYKLDAIPTGFFCDEAATGYNAYSILKSGKDEYGKMFPIFFESFGNYRPGIPIYVTIPFIIIFGLSEFSTRFPSVLIGTATLIAIFLFTQALFSSRIASICAAALLCISPWHIHFSRYGDGNIYIPFFLTIGCTFFLYFIKRSQYLYIFLAIISFGIGIYTYFQAYYLIPLFIVFLVMHYKKELFALAKQRFALSLSTVVVLLFLITPLAIGMLNGEALARFRSVNQTTNQMPFSTTTIAMLKTYFQHFSFDFLFLKGDIGFEKHFITRFSVKGFGELFIFQLPLIAVGLYYACKKNIKSFYLLLFWILVYPIGSSLAPFADGGGPFATRSIIGVIPFQILSAVGFLFFLKTLSQREKTIGILSFSILLFIMGFIYLKAYYISYPLYSSDFWGWQYGARDILSYFKTHVKDYNSLYMIGEFNRPDIFLKFYDTENICNNKCKLGDAKNIDTKERKLFAISTNRLGEIPKNYTFEVLKTLYYPNKIPAYYIGEVRQRN